MREEIYAEKKSESSVMSSMRQNISLIYKSTTDSRSINYKYQNNAHLVESYSNVKL